MWRLIPKTPAMQNPHPARLTLQTCVHAFAMGPPMPAHLLDRGIFSGCDGASRAITVSSGDVALAIAVPFLQGWTACQPKPTRIFDSCPHPPSIVVFSSFDTAKSELPATVPSGYDSLGTADRAEQRFYRNGCAGVACLHSPFSPLTSYFSLRTSGFVLLTP